MKNEYASERCMDCNGLHVDRCGPKLCIKNHAKKRRASREIPKVGEGASTEAYIKQFCKLNHLKV